MKEVLFLSGKGGTGKTSLVASMAYWADRSVIADYDVDASNLPILLNHSEPVKHDFISGEEAEVDPDRCGKCDLCGIYCRFGAIREGEVISWRCEGCGLCSLVCPTGAIRLYPQSGGSWFEAVTEMGHPFYYAELRPHQSNSGKLVSQVKTAAWEKHAYSCEIMLSDGPPGLGCPVIAALNRVALVVLVAEPSHSGFSDLQRLYELLQTRRVKASLVINKWDINSLLCGRIMHWATRQGIPCLGKVPFLETIPDAINLGQIPATFDDVAEVMKPIWHNLRQALIDFV